MERFDCNSDLFERRIMDFVEVPSFIVLHDAIHTRNCKQAFEAAYSGIDRFYQKLAV